MGLQMSRPTRTNRNFSGLKNMLPRLLAFFAAFLGALHGASPLALSDGEVMTFRVGWGIFVHAGEITISARNELKQCQPRLRVTTTTATRGFLRNFFPFDATGEAWFDTSNSHLTDYTEESVSKKKQTRQSLDFDYTRSKAAYVNALQPERNAELDLPAGHPMDLIMSLLQTRTWQLKPGEKQDVLVIFDDDFYELTIYADAYEDIRTPLGKFRTLRLTPRMEKTEPKGMFKRGSSVHVWISQDEAHLPVQFEVEFKFGSGVASLIDHRITPTSAQPAATEPPPP